MRECWQPHICMATWRTLLTTLPEERCAYMGTQYTHLGFYVQAPFRYGILTRQMQMFNEAMSAVRASVEWLFRDIINFFFFLIFGF